MRRAIAELPIRVSYFFCHEVIGESNLGPEPAAAGGGNRQAECRKPQEAAECRDYAGFPDRE